MLLEAYWRAASTSTGATLAAESQVIQPIVKLVNEPKAKWGKRTTPPETGNIVPQLGEGEGDAHDHHPAEDPGEDRRRAGELC